MFSDLNLHSHTEKEGKEKLLNAILTKTKTKSTSSILSPRKHSSSSSTTASRTPENHTYLPSIPSSPPKKKIMDTDAPAAGKETGAATSSSKDPSGFLSEIIGAPITVKLNSGVEYKGELQSVDGYMNIALENTKEYVSGKLKNTFGDVFIRGNNVLYISADQ